MESMTIFAKDFQSFTKTVPEILKESGLAAKIKDKKRIVLKPNLTIDRQPPCTTPVKLVEQVVKFCLKNSKTEIIIAEGSGGCPTEKAFRRLGYSELAEKYHIGLVDLNSDTRITLTDSKALVLKEFSIPQTLLHSFFINLPVLKEHDEAVVTCAMKNLFGIYLNRSRRLLAWWNKSELHRFGVHESIIDLNRYQKSDFILVDASVGQKGNEVTGEPFQPPIKKLIAGFDALAIDKFCAPLLGHQPENIPYLKINRDA